MIEVVLATMLSLLGCSSHDPARLLVNMKASVTETDMDGNTGKTLPFLRHPHMSSSLQTNYIHHIRTYLICPSHFTCSTHLTPHIRMYFTCSSHSFTCHVHSYHTPLPPIHLPHPLISHAPPTQLCIMLL